MVCLRCGGTAGRATQVQRWLGAPCSEEMSTAAMPEKVIAAFGLQTKEWRASLSAPKAERVVRLLVEAGGAASGGATRVLRWKHLGL